MTTAEAQAGERLETLMAAVAGGDRQAFRRLYDRTAGRSYALAMRLLRSRDLAEEVVQEAYIRVWARAAQYDAARGDALAWLAGLVRNLAIDRLRRQGRPDAPLDELPEIAAPFTGDPADRQDVRRCLASLEEAPRRALMLTYYDGLTHGELARAMGAPLGTVKAWVRRGLLRMRRCMDA